MKKLWLIGLIVLLTGCNAAPPSQIHSVVSAEKPILLPLYYTAANIEKSPFEPDTGCMVGANIARDRFINADQREFEQLTGKNHDMYGLSMKANAPFPIVWALDCYAHNKTPVISLYPQNPNMPFDLKSVAFAARTLNTFSIPMLVEFYPDPSRYGDSTEYVAFYQQARALFQRLAPKASFVWTVSPGLPNQGTAYYPGDEYTDWIGLRLYLDSQTQSQEALLKLKAWGYQWQQHKPLLVNLAVSHYSTGTTVYTEQESAKLLTALYEEIQKFPRMKCVLYQDENTASGAPVKTSRENYLITDNQVMLTAYKEAVSHSYFTPNKDGDSPQWFKSPFDACELNGRIFIPVNALNYDLNTTMVAPTRMIDGRQYISQDAFSRYKITKTDGKIYLSALDL